MRRYHISSAGRRLVAQVLVMLSGSVIAQIITFGSAPILSRIFDPQAFGVFGTFTAILAVLASLTTLNYPLAINLAQTDEEVKLLVCISLIATIVTSLLAVFVISLLHHKIVEGFASLSRYIYLIPVAMFFSGISQIATQLLIRKSRFRTLSNNSVFQALFNNASKIGFGWFFPNAAVLIVATCGSLAVAASVLLFAAIRSVARSTKFKLNDLWVNMRTVARRHLDFAIYRTPQVFINAISFNVITLFLGLLMSLEAAGYYLLARTVLLAPVSLIVSAVDAVVYPRFAEIHRSGKNLRDDVVKGTLTLAVLGIGPFLLVTVCGPYLFELFFGIRWRQAGIYAQLLSPLLFLQFINRPAVTIFPILKHQKWLLHYEIASTSAKCLAIFVGLSIFRNDVIAIAMFAAAGSISYAWMIGIAITKSRNHNASKTS